MRTRTRSAWPDFAEAAPQFRCWIRWHGHQRRFLTVRTRPARPDSFVRTRTGRPERSGVRYSQAGDNMRFGFHLYNDEADVDTALNAVTDTVTS
jgi:selenocysteine lyase/cysteine desulfurase